jgi:hypothetical protein
MVKEANVAKREAHPSPPRSLSADSASGLT